MYDYEKGKERIVTILNNNAEIEEVKSIPKDEKEFTYGNGIYSWVTAVFVDIRGSKDIYANEDKRIVAKLIRAFTSEVIQILDDETRREIGIQGDCVYSIYSSSTKESELNIADKTFYVNTFMKMLNTLLEEKGYSPIKVGIGMSTDKELIIKAGKKGSGINSKVWIGEAVSKAAYYSSLGNKDGNEPIVYGSQSYKSFIDKLCDRNSTKNPRDWFKYVENENIYIADIIKVEFNEWIANGLKEEKNDGPN
ncbi:adenylate/guanylate cyclase domain-containing protein [Mycoplasmatota bacterium WC44]